MNRSFVWGEREKDREKIYYQLKQNEILYRKKNHCYYVSLFTMPNKEQIIIEWRWQLKKNNTTKLITCKWI